MEKNIIVLTLLMIITVLVTLLYIRDYADIVAGWVGNNYLVGLGLFPMFIGLIIGSTGVFFISVKNKKKL